MDALEKTLKLNVCSTCIHSKCNSGALNKCSNDELVCAQSSEEINKMLNKGIACPKGYWSFTTGPSCGCGK